MQVDARPAVLKPIKNLPSPPTSPRAAPCAAPWRGACHSKTRVSRDETTAGPGLSLERLWVRSRRRQPRWECKEALERLVRVLDELVDLVDARRRPKWGVGTFFRMLSAPENDILPPSALPHLLSHPAAADAAMSFSVNTPFFF